MKNYHLLVMGNKILIVDLPQWHVKTLIIFMFLGMCKKISYLDPLHEDLLQKNNKIIWLPCRKVLWRNHSHGWSFWVPNHYYFCKKIKLHDKKLIIKGLCKSQKFVSHFCGKVMGENLTNCIFQKVQGLTCHYNN